MSIFKKAQPGQKTPKGNGVDKRNRSLKRLSITSTVLFIVVVLAFNIIFDNLLGDAAKWDWSSTQQYSIGDVSQAIVSGLEKDIQIIGLFDKDTDTTFTDIRRLIDDYVQKSSGRVSSRYVDPDKTPSILTEIDPENYLKLTAGIFVVFCPETGKAKAVTENDIYQYQFDQQTYQQYLTGITAEESFSGAIKYVQSETTPVLYFTTGHGELDFTTDYSLLVDTMQNNNYDVKPLDTFTLSKIPEDCAVLIIAEPEKDITGSEKIMMSNYLKSGGSLMVIAGFGNASFPVLNELLAEHNLEISNDKIREGDVDFRLNNDAYYLRANAPASKVTASAVERFTLMENVRGMNILSNAKEWITTEPVLTTSVLGVTEAAGNPAASSEPGTQTVAVLCENTGFIDSVNVTESAKVMLIGSSSMFNDTLLQTYGSNVYNFAIFFYGVQWMSNTSELDDLMIEAKKPVSYNFTAGTQGGYNFSAILTFIILPVLMLVAALLIYRKRKHL